MAHMQEIVQISQREGNQDADADNSDHAAEQNASPVGTSTGNSIDPWANEVSNHSYGQEDTGLAQEQERCCICASYTD